MNGKKPEKCLKTPLNGRPFSKVFYIFTRVQHINIIFLDT